MNHFNDLKAVTRFTITFKYCSSSFKECLRADDRKKERMAFTSKTMLSASLFILKV